jgi:hypothetical protein
MNPSLKSEAAVSKAFKLSRRLSVEFTIGPAGFVCEWDPDVPTRLTPREERRYLQARDEMMQRLATLIGGRVLSIDHEGAQAIDPEGGTA